MRKRRNVVKVLPVRGKPRKFADHLPLWRDNRYYDLVGIGLDIQRSEGVFGSRGGHYRPDFDRIDLPDNFIAGFGRTVIEMEIFHTAYRVSKIFIYRDRTELGYRRGWERDTRSGKTYLFLMPPQDEDLADVIFSSEPLSLSDLGQVSNDSEYTDHKKISEGIHQVYWKPKKGEVKIAKPYKHHIRTHYPISIKPVYKSMTIPFAAKTIRFQLSAQSNIPIEKIVVFRGSRFFNVKNSDKIASRAEKIRWKRAPLPKIVGNNFTWNLTNIEPGTTYFVVVFLKS